MLIEPGGQLDPFLYLLDALSFRQRASAAHVGSLLAICASRATARRTRSRGPDDLIAGRLPPKRGIVRAEGSSSAVTATRPNDQSIDRHDPHCRCDWSRAERALLPTRVASGRNGFSDIAANIDADSTLALRPETKQLAPLGHGAQDEALPRRRNIPDNLGGVTRRLRGSATGSSRSRWKRSKHVRSEPSRRLRMFEYPLGRAVGRDRRVGTALPFLHE